jgi:predicted Zn-dependent protease with MMP-like domain
MRQTEESHGMAGRRAWGPAPSVDDLAEMAEATLERLDEPFRTLAASVVIRIEEFADDETLAELGITDAFELTGLYIGSPLPTQTPSSPDAQAPVVLLYRSPILAEWTDLGDVDLETLLGHVLIHELAHHFGWSDEEIDRALEDDQAPAR